MKTVGVLIALGFVVLLLAEFNLAEAQETNYQLNQQPQELQHDDGLVLAQQNRGLCLINPSLCKAQCILRGHKNGVCNKKKVCTCRR